MDSATAASAVIRLRGCRRVRDPRVYGSGNVLRHRGGPQAGGRGLGGAARGPTGRPRRRALRLQHDRKVVGAAHAAAEPGDVGPVDVHGDRDVVAPVAYPVDVARRGEPADLAEAAAVLADRVQLLELDALQDAEHAPGDVVVDGRHLARPPDQGDDGERAIGLGMDDVRAVAVRVALAFLRSQDLRAGQIPPQLIRHEHGGLLPVGVPPRGAADSGDQLTWTSGTNGTDSRHAYPPAGRSR